MTKFKCASVEINSQPAQVIKQHSFGAQVESKILDLSDLDLSLRVPDNDLTCDEIVITLRLTKETEYTS